MCPSTSNWRDVARAVSCWVAGVATVLLVTTEVRADDAVPSAARVPTAAPPSSASTAAASAPAVPDDAPVATAGTDLMPASATGATGATGASGGGAAGADVAALQARLDDLERRLHMTEQAQKAAALKNESRWWDRFHVSGFVQPQLVWQSVNAAASLNASLNGGVIPAGAGSNSILARPDGTTTNGDFFRLRRARLKTEYMPTDYARLIFEIDPAPPGTTERGFGRVETLARQVEAQGITRLPHDIILVWGAGIFRLPFGYEVQQSDADRPFIEHSWGEQNMMPGEYDTGAHVEATLLRSRLHVSYALVNGVMEGEPTFGILPDLNRQKDSVARVNYNFGSADVGISGYAGEGQVVDGTDLRFKNFRRDAVDFEAGFHQRLSKTLGWTRAYGELIFGTNMDRGVMYGSASLPSIPTPIGADVASLHERSSWIRVEQDLTRWATLGLRYDFYTPDSALSNNGRNTYSIVAVAHFTRGLQLMAEYDYAIDNVHAAGTVAPSKHIDAASAVLQARF